MSRQRPVHVGALRGPQLRSTHLVAMRLADNPDVTHLGRDFATNRTVQFSPACNPGFVGTLTPAFIASGGIDDLVDCHACLRLIKVAHS